MCSDYFATVGRGLEPFAVDQLKSLGASGIELFDGKVAFSLDQTRCRVLGQLRFVERVLATVRSTALADCRRASVLREIAASFTADALHNAARRRRHAIDCLADAVPSASVSANDDATVTYRLSIKMSGSIGKRLDKQRLLKDLAHRIKINTSGQWMVQLRSAQCEICMSLNDRQLLIGIPISSEPVSSTTWHRGGVRSTVCQAAASLCLAPAQAFAALGALQAAACGHGANAPAVVCDPFAGTGALPIAMRANHPTRCFCLAGDLNAATSTGDDLGRIQWNFLYTGMLRRGVIDLVLTDLPFGFKHQFAAKLGAQRFYQVFLQQTAAALSKPGGRLVCLVNARHVDAFCDTGEQFALKLVQRYDLSLGLTCASLLCLCN